MQSTTMEPRVFRHQCHRPGPQPFTASEAMRTNRQNGMTKRAVERTVRQMASVPTLPFAAYAHDKVVWHPTKPDAFGQQWYQTKVQELFVFSHQIDKKGTLEFMVLNPANGRYVRFVPKGYIPGKDQFNGTASATGVFGRHAERITVATATTIATAGLGSGLGLTGLGVRAFLGRFTIDAGIQFLGGLMAHDLNVTEATEEINLTSSFLAGALPGGGLLGSLRNNSIGALAELKPSIDSKSLKVEMADFSTLAGALNYAQKVGFGVATDHLTGKLSAMAAPARGASTSAMRRTANPSLRWVHAQRVQLLRMYDYVVEASKSVGEGLSNLTEDALKPAAPTPARTRVKPKQ